MFDQATACRDLHRERPQLAHEADHDGLIGLVEASERIHPLRPPTEKTQVEVGVNESGRSLNPE